MKKGQTNWIFWFPDNNWSISLLIPMELYHKVQYQIERLEMILVFGLNFLGKTYKIIVLFFSNRGAKNTEVDSINDFHL